MHNKKVLNGDHILPKKASVPTEKAHGWNLKCL